ncbi:hypothetical protein [Reinekea sp. G2M2-21]|uniref:hypothetical protein n=1 Tax=Reinekea sp. G2M2-21 TaxID=2788942 RepID=UPI0018ABAFDF|nr:hypothetical protein [Reinekea sp. G2M2-21]
MTKAAVFHTQRGRVLVEESLLTPAMTHLLAAFKAASEAIHEIDDLVNLFESILQSRIFQTDSVTFARAAAIFSSVQSYVFSEDDKSVLTSALKVRGVNILPRIVPDVSYPDWFLWVPANDPGYKVSFVPFEASAAE